MLLVTCLRIKVFGKGNYQYLVSIHHWNEYNWKVTSDKLPIFFFKPINLKLTPRHVGLRPKHAYVYIMIDWLGVFACMKRLGLAFNVASNFELEVTFDDSAHQWNEYKWQFCFGDLKFLVLSRIIGAERRSGRKPGATVYYNSARLKKALAKSKVHQ
jgi:hypothetical protein